MEYDRPKLAALKTRDDILRAMAKGTITLKEANVALDVIEERERSAPPRN